MPETMIFTLLMVTFFAYEDTTCESFPAWARRVPFTSNSSAASQSLAV